MESPIYYSYLLNHLGAKEDEAAMQFQAKVRGTFSKLFQTIPMPPEVEKALPIVMKEFRDASHNTGYSPISKLRDETFSLVRMEALIQEGESNFVRAVYDAMATEPGHLQEQKLRHMQDVRRQLAELYTETEQTRLQSNTALTPMEKEAMLAMTECMEGLLCGGVSAFALNTLKAHKLIGEQVKSGKLYDAVDRGGVKI